MLLILSRSLLQRIPGRFEELTFAFTTPMLVPNYILMATATEQDTASQTDSEEGDPKSKSFLAELESCFGYSDLYVVLQINDRKCELTVLRKAYHKLSIKVHPDRVKPEERGEATHRFQLLGRVYQTLSDPGRRSEYDQFGVIQMEDDANCPDGADSWEEYWRVIHPKVRNVIELMLVAHT